MPPCLSFLFEELASFILEGAFLTVISIVPDAALSADAVMVAVPVDLAVTVPSLPTTAILLLLLVYLILLFEEEPLIDALSLYSSFLPRVIASFDNWTLVVTKLPDGICLQEVLGYFLECQMGYQLELVLGHQLEQMMEYQLGQVLLVLVHCFHLNQL